MMKDRPLIQASLLGYLCFVFSKGGFYETLFTDR